jgi:hypothetical protein
MKMREKELSEKLLDISKGLEQEEKALRPLSIRSFNFCLLFLSWCFCYLVT